MKDTSLRPLRSKLLVNYVKPAEKTASGFFIPEVAQRRNNPYTRAQVVAIGPDVAEINLGDFVYVEGHRSGQKYDDQLFIVEYSNIHFKETE